MGDSSLSYQAIRTANQAREADGLRTDSRKKNILLLILNYLSEGGYVESAQSLSKETNLDVTKYEVCDNVDLETILMEYESYYFVKFAKYPKLTKKLPEDKKATGKPPKLQKSRTGLSASTGSSVDNSFVSNTPSLPRIPQGGAGAAGGSQRPASSTGRRIIRRQDSSSNSSSAMNSRQNSSTGRAVAVNGSGATSHDETAVAPPGSLALQGLVIKGNDRTAGAGDDGKPGKRKVGAIIDFRSMINEATRLNTEEGKELGPQDTGSKVMKPLGGYVGYSQEWRELAMVISRDIFMTNPNVRWHDIVGLDGAKRLVKEAVVYPIKYPQLFTGILSPWKGLLLYGPPGTGKTLLAKAVATECQTTFFNISATTIVSKWRGDSEKLVRVLFEMARFHAPSTIFLDELDSLMSQRGGGGAGEHEGSRRMKTELLIQMDGLSKSDDLVFLLAASNLPWELDHAMLRRLEKRIIVDLPTLDARKAMFQHHLPQTVTGDDPGGIAITAELDYDLLALKTEGYSGSDIKLVCKEAAMRPIRKIFDRLESCDGDGDLEIELDTLTTDDVTCALSVTKPSARTLTKKYIAWQKEYESAI